LAAALLPYVLLAARDRGYHRTLRRVPPFEDIVHLGLLVSLLATVWHAFVGRRGPMLAGLGVVVALGVVDEFGYHRALPSAESDVHAKAHFALFAFFAVVLGVDWLGAHVRHLAALAPGSP
jgi:hypothetical protein